MGHPQKSTGWKEGAKFLLPSLTPYSFGSFPVALAYSYTASSLDFPSLLFMLLGMNPKNELCFPGWALNDRHWATDRAVPWELPATSFGPPLLHSLSLLEW